MSLVKKTTLASIEILLQQRAIQVVRHTSIEEDGVTISGPNVHRQALSEVEDKSEILAEVAAFVSVDYVNALERVAQVEQQLQQSEAAGAALHAQLIELTQLLEQGEAANSALKQELEQMAAANAASQARIAELESSLAQLQAGTE